MNVHISLEKSSKLNNKNKYSFKFLIIKILNTIMMLYLSSIVLTVGSSIIDNIVFKNVINYNNITMRSANPLNEKEATNVLIDVEEKISKSSLYDSDTKYTVCLTNSRGSELVYFKTRDVLNNIAFALKNWSNLDTVDVSTYIFDDSIGGYVIPFNLVGKSYVRSLDAKIVAHEITHLMSRSAFNEPIALATSTLVNSYIHEGYANLIAEGSDIGYIMPEFIGDSGSYSIMDTLHKDGIHYRHRYETFTFKPNYYVGKYSLENMLIINELLLENHIVDLFKGFTSKDKLDKATNSFFINQLNASNYHKVNGDKDELTGEWLRFLCDYRDNPCKYIEE